MGNKPKILDEKEKSSVNIERSRRISRVILVRGLLIIIIELLMLFEYSPEHYRFSIWLTLPFIVLYNLTIIAYIIIKKFKVYFPVTLLYIDAAILNVLLYQCGQQGYEILVLLIFIVGYSTVYEKKESIIRLSIFSSVLYTISYLFSFGISDSILRLIVHNLLIFTCAVAITNMNKQVMKFDEMHKKEFALARTDKLTGLFNRHSLEQKINEDITYAEYTGKPVNVLIFDLDNFKGFNDTYGHTCGDKLLVLFSEIIRQNIRKTDTAFRYGGEEFLILIRDLDLDSAKAIGERIRNQLEKQKMYAGFGDKKDSITASCGIAQYPFHSTDMQSVIEFADNALYKAKSQGKNKIAVYGKQS